ncbi:MAG: DUF3168 domain-containing protein [Vicinamibacterales bacterium]
MMAVDNALYALLTEDAQLRALAPGGVYRGTADQDAPTPYVSYQQQAGDRRYTFGSGWRELTYQIKAVDQNDDSEPAQRVQQRLEVLLQHAVLTLDGYGTLIVSQVSDIEYEEPGERPWQHVGGLWEIKAQ